MTPQQKQEIKDLFYKERGQYCSDVFEEIADWWLTLLDREIEKATKELKEQIENVLDCEHQCTSECRRSGCNCACGEYHSDDKECIREIIN